METHLELEEEIHRLASALRARIPELARSIHRHVHDEVPEYFIRDDPGLAEAGEAAVVSSLTEIFDALDDRANLPSGAPEATLREARLAAQAGVELQGLLRTWRVAQAVTWDFILEVATDQITSPSARSAVLRRVSQFHFAWNDRGMAALVDTYERERASFFVRGAEREAHVLIQDVLGGLPPATSRLSYDFQGEHTGFVAWGAGAEIAAQGFAKWAGGELLSMKGTDGAVIGWAGRPVRGRRARSTKPLEPPRDTFLACGETSPGIEGFRLTYRQAWQAYRVSRIVRQPVTWYADVALESLMLRDLQGARDLVAYSLGALGESSHRAEVLRETLRAYFASDQNAVSTAHRLHIHERTVSYRLRSIEGWLGATIASRRDELAISLRLHRLLEVEASGQEPVLLGDDV